MDLSKICLCLLVVGLITACAGEKGTTANDPVKPNIIFVMVDDLGYGDLGAFGQQVIQTPNLDRMAREGRKYTQVYAGSPVCAPSRSTLMTGKHTGHTTVRGNKTKVPMDPAISPNPVRVPLLSEDVTLAEIMKSAGYTTGMFGKWGLGEPGSAGEPNDQGFDEWTGFLNQKRAHNHYVDYFWQNKDTLKLEGNRPQEGVEVTYSHDLFTSEALQFIDKNSKQPFFLYLPYCLPHDRYQIPAKDTLKFADKDWGWREKVYAAMVEKIDVDMGKLFSKLKAQGLDKNTLVLFCSDNGAARRWEGRFDSSGELRVRKRDMYEGGIRSPMIVWMAGVVPAGTESDLAWYFPDVMPTLAEVAQADTPQEIDGISVWEDLQGKSFQSPDRYLYWEFHEGGFFQAIRYKDWKGVRQGLEGKLELYDLSKDVAEKNNLADTQPDVVKMLEQFLAEARTESPYWAVQTEMKVQ